MVYINHESEIGWSYNAAWKNIPPVPIKPLYTGNIQDVERHIVNDGLYATFVAEGANVSDAWFVKHYGEWMRVVHDYPTNKHAHSSPEQLYYYDRLLVAVERVPK